MAFTPHTEQLITNTEKSWRDLQRARAEVDNLTEIYRADLQAALATREHGVRTELARRLGVARQTLTVQADETVRAARRDAKRVKKD